MNYLPLARLGRSGSVLLIVTRTARERVNWALYTIQSFRLRLSLRWLEPEEAKVLR